MRVTGQQFNYKIDTFDGAVEYIADMIGSDFLKAVELTNMIIASPSDYTGPQASMAAMRLAGYRVKIGQASQYWKRKEADVKHPHDRLIKDAYHCMWEGLLEMINCLKAAAKNEREIIGGG